MLSCKLASRLLAYHIKDYVAALARLMEGCRRPFARLHRRRPLPGKTLAAEAGLSSAWNLPRWSACSCFRNFQPCAAFQAPFPASVGVAGHCPDWLRLRRGSAGTWGTVLRGSSERSGPTTTTACHSCVENSRKSKLARTIPRTPPTPSETLREEGDCLYLRECVGGTRHSVNVPHVA